MSEFNKEEEPLASCSIGKDAAASKCHVIFYAKIGFKPFSDLTECDQKLLVLRSEAKLEENSIICFLSEYQSMKRNVPIHSRRFCEIIKRFESSLLSVEDNIAL